MASKTNSVLLQLNTIFFMFISFSFLNIETSHKEEIINPVSTFGIRLNLNSVDCEQKQVCYTVELQSTSGSNLNLAGQNYRLFYDTELASFQSGTSLLPSNYQDFTLIQNIQNVNAALISDSLDFDEDLGFLNFAIDLNDITNGGVALPADSTWISTSELCFEVTQSLLEEPSSFLEMVWARNEKTQDYASSFVEISEWIGTNMTQATIGDNYDDLNLSDGEAANFVAACAPASFDIRLQFDSLDCAQNKAFYEVQLRSSNGKEWSLAGQNYRLYYDASLASFQSGTSLLGGQYQDFTLIQDIQNINAPTPSGNLAFENNLSFLNYSMDLIAPSLSGINLPSDNTWQTTSRLCFQLNDAIFGEADNCLEIIWGRAELTSEYATSFVEIAEWVTANNTQNAVGATYDDIEAADGDGACFTILPPQAINDTITFCPGITSFGNTSFNDVGLSGAIYTLLSPTINGTVVLDSIGNFSYSPLNLDCGLDAFSYTICNENLGCCDTAISIIQLEDTTIPELVNIPSDLTINCDETIPDPMPVLAIDDCPGIYISLEETNSEIDSLVCSYTICRTWTATDLCGNSIAASQLISVEDQAPPGLFQVQTLANGKKMIAGKTKGVRGYWKTIIFPIIFDTIPVVLCQILSDEDNPPLIVQIQNVSNSQFEMKLQNEEAEGAFPKKQQVSWIAIEPGNYISSEGFEIAKTMTNTSSTTGINFFQSFANPPNLFAQSQSTNEEDPFSLRIQNITTDSATLLLQEETSFDLENQHLEEDLAYFGLVNIGDFSNSDMQIIGESGQLSITSAWETVVLNQTYNNPCIITSLPTLNDPKPTIVQIRNLENNSFDIRLWHWDYQTDTSHLLENIAYFIVESSLPLNNLSDCQNWEQIIDENTNQIAFDNCQLAMMDIQINSSDTTAQWINLDRTFSITDQCGNNTIISQNIACPHPVLGAKVRLQGALIDNGGGALMRDDLREKGYLPFIEPYSYLTNFEHQGSGGGEQITEDLLMISGENAIVDWVFVELRELLDNSNILETRAVLLQRDGDLMDLNGDSLIHFYHTPPGSYYFSIRHRNHLGIISPNPESFTDATVFVDFINNPAGGVLSQNSFNGKNALWAGNLNNDKKIIYQGPQNDVFSLFLEVIQSPENTDYLANFIHFGYEVADLNLDGNTIYQGPNNEKISLLLHTILAHPSNINFFSNFSVEEQLPDE